MLDFFGFATLSIAIGTFQALLDRGEQLDWFSSLDQMLGQQASMIAYDDAFKLMFIATLVVVPLLAVIKRPQRHAPEAEAVHVAMD